MSSDVYGEKLKELYPVVEPNLSDSGAADCVLEFLVMAGQRSLPEVQYSRKKNLLFTFYSMTKLSIQIIFLKIFIY